MRTVRESGLPHNTNIANHPDGAIRNENESIAGTPVVEQIYGDILTNIYAVLRSTGVVPNNNQDNESNGYQFVDALRKFTNELNDVQQILNLTSNVWDLPIDISRLPNKYVLVAEAGADYDSSQTYTIKGSGVNPTYSFTSTGFNNRDIIIITLDQSESKAISLSALNNAMDNLLTPFGVPLAYNDTSTLYYYSDGKLITDFPRAFDLITSIRVDANDFVATITDVVILKNHVLCMVYLPGTLTYSIYQFDLALLIDGTTTAEEIVVSGVTIPSGGVNNQPYLFSDGSNVFITNLAGSNASDEVLATMTYDTDTMTLALSSQNTLDSSFQKTTNTIVRNGMLFTLIDSVLVKHTISSGDVETVNDFGGVNGVLFQLNENVYFGNGSVAKIWTI